MVGHHAGEALGDAAQFDGRCRRPRAGGAAGRGGVGGGDGDLLLVVGRFVALEAQGVGWRLGGPGWRPPDGHRDDRCGDGQGPGGCAGRIRPSPFRAMCQTTRRPVGGRRRCRASALTERSEPWWRRW
ncbi:hypothetical protein KCH_31740 [Kitasatospora cheerisanensis KCTC 2395]|uniref:Uncharacterized protein n=1 Tax=Kitasatospora cheerisanensis KCTC 2395 TaxID=1348663 RepID=A0A066Z4H8_9ACTN|nr:hypothetical protein KCH_31740 [Kitasatospora cheerisanensis KCTC 2395]